jgi:hypothetical protein
MSRINNIIGASRVPSGLLPFLTAYWTADNIATDVHINNLGGSGVSLLYGTGINNEGFDFVNDASVRYVNVPDNNLLSFTDGANDVPFTIRMWVYFNSKSSTGNWLANKRDNTNQREWQILHRTSISQVEFMKFSQGGTDSVTTNTGVNPANDVFHHLVLTSDGTKFGDKIYLNGTDITTGHTETGTYVKMNNGTNFMRFGANAWDTPPVTPLKHRGLLDEIAIFNGYEMTPADVIDDYNLGVGKFYPNI